MRRALFRHLLFIVVFLLAQAGALTHGVSHLKDASHGHQPVCEQCLAYSAVGAAATGSPPAWSAPAIYRTHAAPPPAGVARVFHAAYRSRAPPC